MWYAPDVRLAEVQAHCYGEEAKATCQTGPHGEHIEIMDLGPGPDDVHGRTIYVYSGHTIILAGTHNQAETAEDFAPPTRAEPPLTVEQLIELATKPRWSGPAVLVRRTGTAGP